MPDAINPLDHPCGHCLAEPGQPCRSSSTDQPTRRTHRLRGLAAHRRLERCDACDGIGWVPASEPTMTTEAPQKAAGVTGAPSGTPDAREGLRGAQGRAQRNGGT